MVDRKPSDTQWVTRFLYILLQTLYAIKPEMIKWKGLVVLSCLTDVLHRRRSIDN